MNTLKCSALYHHINIRNDDRIFPCCRFKKPIAKFDGTLTLNSPEYDNIRKNFHKGLSECQKCFDEEKTGIKPKEATGVMYAMMVGQGGDGEEESEYLDKEGEKFLDLINKIKY